MGPYLIGALSQASGNFYSAMWLMAGTLGLAAAAAGVCMCAYVYARLGLRLGMRHSDCCIGTCHTVCAALVLSLC